LFSEEEADLFIQLTPMFESAEDVAKRLGREMEQLVELLNRMTQKGQLYRYKQDETETFATMPYITGIFESVVIDRELAVAIFMISWGRIVSTVFPFCIFVRNRISVMAIVAGKTVDFQGIAGFLMGLKPDIISIMYHRCGHGRITCKACLQKRLTP